MTTDTPITALFGHLCSFAKTLEKDLGSLSNSRKGSTRGLYSGDGLPILQHVHTTTANTATHIQSMLDCCNPSMKDIVTLCAKIYEENERGIDTVEKELQRYGYEKAVEDRKKLYSFDWTAQPNEDTQPIPMMQSAKKAVRQSNYAIAPSHPIVGGVESLVDQASPRTPTLEECGGISNATLALLSAHGAPKTPKLDLLFPLNDSLASAAQLDVNRQLFHGDCSQVQSSIADECTAMEIEDTTVSMSLALNGSTIHPVMDEVSAEEFETVLPVWLQGVLGNDTQVVNKCIKLINEYVSDKWFQMDEEAKDGSDNAYSLTKDELERIIGLPDKVSKGFLLSMTFLRRLISRSVGSETLFFLK